MAQQPSDGRRGALLYFGRLRGGNWRGGDVERKERKGLLHHHDCGSQPGGSPYRTRYRNIETSVCCARQCCAFNISYIISAPLHYQGFHQFWYAADGGGRLFAFCDVLLHLLHWVVALVLDIWIVLVDGLEHQWLREIQNGALICLCIAFFGLVVAQALGLLGQPAGKAWPSTVGLVMGGGIASTVFSVVLCLSFSFAVPDVSVRICALATVAIKIIALATARANIDFWGSCEQADKLDNICAFMASKKTSNTVVEVAGIPVKEEEEKG